MHLICFLPLLPIIFLLCAANPMEPRLNSECFGASENSCDLTSAPVNSSNLRLEKNVLDSSDQSKVYHHPKFEQRSEEKRGRSGPLVTKKALAAALLVISLKALGLLGLVLTSISLLGAVAIFISKLSLSISFLMFIRKLFTMDFQSDKPLFGLNPLGFPHAPISPQDYYDGNGHRKALQDYLRQYNRLSYHTQSTPTTEIAETWDAQSNENQFQYNSHQLRS